MKRKTTLYLFLAFAFLAVVFLLAPSTFAQDPVDVFPFLDGVTYNADENQPIHLIWAWVATTPGQVRVFWNHVEQTYLMTGPGDPPLDLDSAAAEQYWGPLISLPPEDLGWDCPMPNIWGAFWEYTIDPLPAGTYTLVFTQTFNNPTNDGLHVCTFAGTSIPVVPPPSLFTGDDNLVATSTIVVSPAP